MLMIRIQTVWKMFLDPGFGSATREAYGAPFRLIKDIRTRT